MYTQDYKVKFYDANHNGKIRLSTVMKLASDIAGEDFTNAGYSHEFLWKNDMVFLVSRVSVSFSREIKKQENIKITTEPREIKGVLFTRDVDFFVGDDLAISHKSGWVLVSLLHDIYTASFYNFDINFVKSDHSNAQS